MHFKSKRLVQCWIFILDVGSPVLPIFLLPNFDTSTSTHRLLCCCGSRRFRVLWYHGFFIFRGKETNTGCLDHPVSSVSCSPAFFILLLCYLKFLYCILQYNWLYLNLFHNNTILHLDVLEYFFWARHSLDLPFCAGWGIALVSQDSCLQFDIFNILPSQNCSNFDRIESLMLQLLSISYFGEVERVCLQCALIFQFCRIFRNKHVNPPCAQFFSWHARFLNAVAIFWSHK